MHNRRSLGVYGTCGKVGVDREDGLILHRSRLLDNIQILQIKSLQVMRFRRVNVIASRSMSLAIVTAGVVFSRGS
jgi:hypothetical protein